jgi:hypothetical protein
MLYFVHSVLEFHASFPYSDLDNYILQCFESGSRYFAESGFGSSLLLNPDPDPDKDFLRQIKKNHN